MYKKIFENKKAVFFDLDGTIINSEPYWTAAFMKVLHGIGYDWALPTLCGLSVTERWKNLLSELGIKTNLTASELAAHTCTAFLEYLKDIELTDGFYEFARELKKRNFKLALTSNTDREVVGSVLNHLVVKDLFDFTICGNEVKRRKPDPEIYYTAARKLGLKPKEVLVFEDSVVGAISAAKAGMDLIIIWDGNVEQNLYPSGSKLFIADFVGLSSTIDKTLMDEIKLAAEEIKRDQAASVGGEK